MSHVLNGTTPEIQHRKWGPLAGLTIVDTVLIVILVLEMSIVGVFMKKEPWWYIISYPYFFHPGRGIVQVTKKPFIPCGTSIIAVLVVEFSRKVFGWKSTVVKWNHLILKIGVTGRCQKVQKLDFQSQFSTSKIIQIFLILFHWRVWI